MRIVPDAGVADSPCADPAVLVDPLRQRERRVAVQVGELELPSSLLALLVAAPSLVPHEADGEQAHAAEDGDEDEGDCPDGYARVDVVPYRRGRRGLPGPDGSGE